MRVENYRRSLVPVLLAFAVILSIVFIAAPVFATSITPPGWPGSVPSDNYVEVPQGGVFLLRGSITFDQPETGSFGWVLYWYHYGDPTENFSLENTPSVYWTDGTPVENVVIYNHAILNGWQVNIESDANGIERNGTFYIDIWLRAASRDGTPHKAENDNIYFLDNKISFSEPNPDLVPAGPIVVEVIGAGVTVSITPYENSAGYGENLEYTVTVCNTGENDDTYTLSANDTLGWAYSVTPPTISIPAGQCDNATLTVTVGTGTDLITVTADGVYADNGDNCTAA